MGNCYATDHIAKDCIHTDITCNIEESQQKYCLGTVSNRLLGARKLVFMDPNRIPCFGYSSVQPNNYHKFNRPTLNKHHAEGPPMLAHVSRYINNIYN